MRIVYFAWVRERIGRDGEDVDPPPGVDTVSALIGWLAARDPAAAAVFEDRSRLRVALDQRMAPLDSPIAGVREVALFPPVTGG